MSDDGTRLLLDEPAKIIHPYITTRLEVAVDENHHHPTNNPNKQDSC